MQKLLLSVCLLLLLSCFYFYGSEIRQDLENQFKDLKVSMAELKKEIKNYQIKITNLELLLQDSSSERQKEKKELLKQLENYKRIHEKLNLELMELEKELNYLRKQSSGSWIYYLISGLAGLALGFFVSQSL